MSNKTPYNHLLAKHGVLIIFNIAKKVSPSYLKSIKNKLKKAKTKKDIDSILQSEILKSINSEIEQKKIPGLILDIPAESDTDLNTEKIKETKTKPKLCSDNKLMKINLMATNVSKNIITKKLSIDETCYLILSILTSLGLTDENFRNFHKKYNKNYQDDDDESFNDEDEDNSDED